MSRLRFSRRAQHDLDDIGDHITERNPAAAKRWVDLIESKCRLLAEQPGLGRPRSDLRQDVRSLAVGNHVVFYRPIEGGIEVVRVLHGKRDIGASFAGRGKRRQQHSPPQGRKWFSTQSCLERRNGAPSAFGSLHTGQSGGSA